MGVRKRETADGEKRLISLLLALNNCPYFT
jgi:hypothetical protein